MDCNIHKTAIVDSGAQLGVGVLIGAYSVIGPDVVIGDNTEIKSHVVIEGHTTLGAGNCVFQFASVGSVPQDLKYKGEPSTVVIGDRNLIREYVTIQPGTEGGGMTTVVGDQNLFMANSHVGHDSRVGNRNVFANSVALAGHVDIGNNAILGGLAAVHQFVRVGDFALLGGGSMVGQDIPPYCIGQGDRCVIRGVNTIGMERAGMSEDEVKEVKRLYRHFFMSPGNFEKRIESLDADLLSSRHAKIFIDFIRTSTRGIPIGK